MADRRRKNPRTPRMVKTDSSAAHAAAELNKLRMRKILSQSEKDSITDLIKEAIV